MKALCIRATKCTNTKNSSYEEQQRQEQSVAEQPQQEFKKSRKENRHHGIHGQISKQCSVAEPMQLHSCSCEDVIIIDIADIDDSDIWLKMCCKVTHAWETGSSSL